MPYHPSSDDDLPIATKKKKLSASSAAKEKTGSEGRIRNSLRHLKPLFEEGDDVCAAWWPDAKSRRDSVGEWFPGVVKSYRDDVESGSPYGPTRYYDMYTTMAMNLMESKTTAYFPRRIIFYPCKITDSQVGLG